jgi:hypothetical protein
VTKNVFTCIDSVQLVLSILIIVVWINVIKMPTFALENGKEPFVIPMANKMANFQDYYRILCHFNAFITFLRIL